MLINKEPVDEKISAKLLHYRTLHKLRKFSDMIVETIRDNPGYNSGLKLQRLRKDRGVLHDTLPKLALVT